MTARERIDAIYDRIAREGLRPAWISLADRERAAAQAEWAAAHPGLPLAGLPFAVKDNIDVAGMETTAGCPGFAYVAHATNPAVERLEAAGAVLIGKTNLDQFATGLVGTRSPYGAVPNAVDPRFVAGGSSSGSAVVVADGTVSFSIGTDTAGSGRVPAAFNEIVGIKPTRGMLSTRGLVPACRSLDCLSVFAPTVSLAVTVTAAAAGFDPADPWSRRPASAPRSSACPRIGVAGAAEIEHLDVRLRPAWSAAVERAAGLGTVTELDISPFLEAGRLLYEGPWVAERWLAAGAAVTAEVDGLDPVVTEILAGARAHSAADAFAARYRLAELSRESEAAFGAIDLLLLPTAPTLPTPAQVANDPILLNRRLGRWTNHVNLLDLCAIALPAGRGADGLPFGVTAMAPAWSDAALAAFGRAWEVTGKATPAAA